MKIFIAIPPYDKDAQSRVNAIASHFLKYGHAISSPIDLLHPSLSETVGACVSRILLSNVVVMTTGWESNPSSVLFHSCAEAYGMRIIYEETINLIDCKNVVYKDFDEDNHKLEYWR